MLNKLTGIPQLWQNFISILLYLNLYKTKINNFIQEISQNQTC